MAVTSLWRIKGRIGKVVDYAANPEKTENPAFDREDISSVISYAMQQEKTEGPLLVMRENKSCGNLFLE